jgi:ABC-type proline/glycine betaine transport system permease subunit
VRPTSAPIALTSPVSNADGLGSLIDESYSGGTNSALLVGGIFIVAVAVGMTAFVVCRQSRRNAKAIPGLNEPSIDPSEPLSDDEL